MRKYINFVNKYGQYKADIFTKLNYKFTEGKKILDLGCGDGSDAEIFINEYKLDTYGIDIYRNKHIAEIKKLKFRKGGIFKIPFPDSSFDYVFLHDVLHHIDEEYQSKASHLEGLREVKRVCKDDGTIIIIEGNRYNPLFYPHMVKMLGHNHFSQGYFKNIIRTVFSDVKFKYFEAHSYPKNFIVFWKFYEQLMEKIAPRAILSYNSAIIKQSNNS